MAIVVAEHTCKLTDLVTCPKPIEDPNGECVSSLVRCKVCGKEYEEVYSRNDSLWDPAKKEYVELEP